VGIEYRVVDDSTYEAFLRTDARAFGQGPGKPDEPDSWSRAELERARVAVDGSEVVGVGRNYSFELTMPGGSGVPAGAVSWIGVLPTHRRQGVLTGMLAELHADSRDRGEPVSILTASEGSIYGRFGYGVAALHTGVTIETSRARFARPLHDPGRVRFVDAAEAERVFPEVYEVARGARAGMVSRPDYWWPACYWDLPEKGEGWFTVVHEDASGRPDGFAYYEVKGRWEGGFADKTARVVDLITTTPTARAALWHYLVSIDLVQRVHVMQVALDDPIRWLLADVRRVNVDYLHDRLWLLVHDPAAALAARTYAVPGALAIEVHHVDGRAERVALDGGPDGATCTRTTAEPDLALAVQPFAAALLGAVSWDALAQAGLVEERRSGSLARADTMFPTHPVAATLSWF
jgi:predicted acetyltransferase